MTKIEQLERDRRITSAFHSAFARAIAQTQQKKKISQITTAMDAATMLLRWAVEARDQYRTRLAMSLLSDALCLWEVCKCEEDEESQNDSRRSD